MAAQVRYDARAEASSKDPSLAEWNKSYPKLGEALRTCSLRFVINLPEECLRDAPRLCFELQEAFWFYLDYLHENAKKELPKLNQMNFVNLMLEASDLLAAIYDSPALRQKLIQDWREYCRKVPLKGAVLVNQKLDKCLMVQPWKGDKWTYPRGKINEDESEIECAVREVWEETGIDIEGRVDERSFVKADVYGSGCAVKLFLVPDIDEETACGPNTRKEISKIGWIPFCALPGWEDENSEEHNPNLRFFSVAEFVPGIWRWLEEQRAMRGMSTWTSNSLAAVMAANPAPASRHQQFLPPSRYPPSRSPPPRKRESGSSRPRPEAKNQELPIPPPPPTSSRSPTGTASKGGSRGGRLPPPGAGGFGPSKAVSDDVQASSKSNTSKPKVRSNIFSLDLQKVMKEFDRGWQCGGHPEIPHQ